MKAISVFIIAAAAILPIRARIIDCSTIEKARHFCEQENLCCDVLERKMAEEKKTG